MPGDLGHGVCIHIQATQKQTYLLYIGPPPGCIEFITKGGAKIRFIKLAEAH